MRLGECIKEKIDQVDVIGFCTFKPLLKTEWVRALPR
jgi:hypothetical protein